MMKILYVMETISSGGVEQRRLNLIKSLYNNYEFAFICSSADGYVAEELKRLEIPLYEVGSMKSVFNFKIYLKALFFANKFKPDIIHGAVFEGNLQAAFISLLTKNKNLVLEETSDPIGRPRSKKSNYLLKFISLRSKKFIGVSKATYDYLTNVAKVNLSTAVHIDNAVVEKAASTPLELISIKQKYNLADKLVIGTVCRLFDNHKKVSDLIHAFSKSYIHNSNICLLIVGDGPDKAMLQKLSEDLGVADSVIFTGYQKDTKIFYDVMDIFALTSATEAFGLVFVEAMLSRLPIIATNVGGIPYVVRKDKDGLLVGVGEVGDVSEAINRLLDNEELRKNLGFNGYTHAKLKFSFDRYVVDLENIYKGLMK